MARRSSDEGSSKRCWAPPRPAAVAGPLGGDPVRTHLALLLNTPAGAVPNLPDYGCPTSLPTIPAIRRRWALCAG